MNNNETLEEALEIGYYDLLEDAPAYAEHVAHLWSWSENHQYPTPATLFLDLIGYTLDQYGETLVQDLASAVTRLGTMEIAYLADALNEYANRPGDVTEYVEKLIGEG